MRHILTSLWLCGSLFGLGACGDGVLGPNNEGKVNKSIGNGNFVADEECSDCGTEEGGDESSSTSNLPAVPTDLRALEVGSHHVELAWTDQSNNEDKFRIEQRLLYSPFQTVSETETGDVEAARIESLRPTTLYFYRVGACNNDGCSFSNVIAIVTKADTQLTAPVELRAYSFTGDRVFLRWIDTSDSETRFIVERADGLTSNFAVHMILDGADLQSANDMDVVIDQTYSYRIQACNETVCSDYSNEVWVTVRDREIFKIPERIDPY